MTGYLAIIIVLGIVLLVATAYMEWIGVLSILTPWSRPRYPDCGHLRVSPVSPHHRCWRCRRRALDQILHPMHR